jgi:hypothetical protein
MPSKMHVLSIGMYCLVISLIASCATMPPVSAEILCSSPPLVRATSSAASTRRVFWEALGNNLSKLSRISVEVFGPREVDPRAR